ncbi:hypothetical protein [Schlesneria sp. T3-172]|uniref:hypothetical protein n=1 Tax=Schlesneria sphaerica TaxID=3373610 RepID=UPI0037C71E01
MKKNQTFPAGNPEMNFEALSTELKEVPVVIIARTQGEALHGYWGRCVHDFAGYFPPPGPVAIDYAHDDSDSIGVCELSIEGNQLIARGKICPFTADDQASRVIYQASKGIPFQSSIRMATDGLVYDEVADGETVEVNGEIFTGPGHVFRRWSVEGVAILNYGSDAATSVHFDDPGDLTATDFRARGRQFQRAFGREQGAEWFLQGLTFAAAAKLFQTQQAARGKAEISALEAEAARLRGELAEAKKIAEAAKAKRGAAKEDDEKEFRRWKAAKANFRPGQAKPVPVNKPAPAKKAFNTFGRTDKQQAFVDAVAARMPKRG